MLKLSSRKKIIFLLVCFFIFAIILNVRLFYLQLVKGSELSRSSTRTAEYK